MILDTLTNVDRYSALASWIPLLPSLLGDPSIAARLDGKYPLSDGRFLVVQHYRTKLEAQCTWEAHRAYIDFQVVLRGSEHIGYALASQLTPLGSYDAGSDFQAYHGSGCLLSVPEQVFCIFYPGDVHMPGIGEDQAEITKLILKIPISEL